MTLALYRLLMRLALPLVLAYFWWRGRKDPDYRRRWAERLGWHSTPANWQHGTLLHCASVGEVLAARPLIEALLAEHHRHGPLVISCNTPTGSRLITERHGVRMPQLYFPIDLPGAARRFLRALRPRRVLLLEREIWPTFLYEAQSLGIPVGLVNARLSERSAAGYTRWQRLMRPTLARLRLVCAEDAVAAERFRALGVAPERIRVTGNIKSDLRLDAGTRAAVTALRAELGTRPVLTAGSTHAGEDEALIQALRDHLVPHPDALLVLAPRHPERFEPVATCITRAGLGLARRGRGESPTASTQVLLVDTMGELLRWYGAADTCFVGGSLVPRGGHNPLEVLCHEGALLLAGPHTHNFESLYTQLVQADAMQRVADASATFEAWRSALGDPEAARARAARGHAAYQSLAGATSRTMSCLSEIMTAEPPGETLQGKQDAQTAWADARFFRHADPALLDAAWWRQRPGPSHSEDAGRGTVHHVADARHAYLLRHYGRGGLMARWSRDLFLWEPLARSRGMREYTLLHELRARGLPVPQACAARRTRVNGLWYRADILVEIIPGAVDVAKILRAGRGLDASAWHALGHAVRRLHDAQVFHADLNCHNLMLDDAGQAWIVDFDKCGFAAGEDWKQRNLDRLLRSLRKEARLNTAFRWQETQWAYLMRGYESLAADHEAASSPSAASPRST